MSNAREIAMKVIYDVEFNGAYSNMALKKALKTDMPKQDKAFISNLVYGVTDRKLTLDYVIGKFSKIKLKKISKYILIILRMGIYQIMFMDKVPISAAVNESVKLARRYGHGASAGFVNGLLRNVSKTEIEYPSDKTEYLSVKYSFPMWLCEKWIDEFGYDFTEKLIESFGMEKRLNIRPNRLKITADELCKKFNDNGINAEVYDGYIVSDGFDISADSLYNDGYYTIQDSAAMQTAKVLAPCEGDTVIDMCAAPGGKAIHIAELLNGTGHVEARDLTEYKVALIRDNIERSGLTNINAVCQDAAIYDPHKKETADIVIADLPCSGLGVLGKKPDLRYKMNEKTEADLVELQKKILSVVKDYVKPGGKLLYSTCTIHREENEGNVEWFLKEYPEFELVKEKQMIPGRDAGDGFYIAILKRVNHE